MLPLLVPELTAMSPSQGSVAQRPPGNIVDDIYIGLYYSYGQPDRPLINDYLFLESVRPSLDAWQGKIIVSKTRRIICRHHSGN